MTISLWSIEKTKLGEVVTSGLHKVEFVDEELSEQNWNRKIKPSWGGNKGENFFSRSKRTLQNRLGQN